MFTGCAGIYRPVVPENIGYDTYSDLKDSVKISYNYNTQKSFNNKRYRKAERRSGYVAVCINIINHSSEPVVILPNTFLIRLNGKPADIISYKDYVHDVRQITEVYLLYSVFGPWVTENGATSYVPIGLGIGLINFGVASFANKQHEKNMKKNEIWGRLIPPESTGSGVVFIRNFTYDELKFEYLKSI
jgi:hypothetical protein